MDRDLSYLKIDLTRPVVFLDLDGVVGDTWLVHEGRKLREFTHLTHEKVHPRFKGDVIYYPMWDLLRAVFRFHNVQVIIVSSWLHSYLSSDDPTVMELKKFFDYDSILGSLSNGGCVHRSKEIERVVREFQLSDWVVIDDSRTQMYPDTLFFTNNRFVHPRGRWGVGQREIAKLDYILSKGDNEWNNNHFEMVSPSSLMVIPPQMRNDLDYLLAHDRSVQQTLQIYVDDKKVFVEESGASYRLSFCGTPLNLCLYTLDLNSYETRKDLWETYVPPLRQLLLDRAITPT